MRARISNLWSLQVTEGKCYSLLAGLQYTITSVGMHDAIHVATEFLLIFSETNFVEVLKICKIYGPQNKSALRYMLQLIKTTKRFFLSKKSDILLKLLFSTKGYLLNTFGCHIRKTTHTRTRTHTHTHTHTHTQLLQSPTNVFRHWPVAVSQIRLEDK